MILRPTRRAVLGGAAAIAAGVALGRAGGHAASVPLPARAAAPAGVEHEVILAAAERPVALPAFGGRAMPLWTFGETAEFPLVLRLRIGDSLVAHLDNGIPAGQEEMSVHWHGIRLPNAEDGVPYLTQTPVPPGARYSYRFTPPDTGTFWFHTHCNTAESIGRGLLGLIIVEGDETRPYDADLVLCIKDWRIGEDGLFLPFLTDEGASRAGSFGTQRSVNGRTAPAFAVPARGDVRLRLANVDPTRIVQIGVRGAEAAVIATDGNGLPPFPLKAWRIGPAMRLDLVVRAPAAGGIVEIVDFNAKQPVVLATLFGQPSDIPDRDFDPAPLCAPVVPVPDTTGVEPRPMVFSATAAGASVAEAFADPAATILGPLCVTQRTFWAIDKKPWPDSGHRKLPPPLMVLARGEVCRLSLQNVTPHMHPIHLHGHTFQVLGSSNREIVPHFADTVLVTPKERVDIAFVADNPGDWMLHCHIIEHQETGMMGYFRVLG